MKSEKLNALFTFSLDKLTKSLEDAIPEEHKNDSFKIVLTMTHESEGRSRVGLCRCRDGNGEFKWMDCRECNHS